MKPKFWLPVLALLVAVVTLWRTGLWEQASAPPPAAADSIAARTDLSRLVVHERGTIEGYSRDKFPHWETISGKCDTRETVLKRDGQDVQTDAECRAVSGTWHSPYDGATWTQSSDVDIDHLVPLAHAWVSGASSWTTERRKELANDLVRPQLLAVTDRVNQSKGDRAPDEWRPPLQSDWCVYAIDWIEVKGYYQLTVTEAEKTALNDLLDHC